MKRGTKLPTRFSGEVEIDEAFVGGKEKNKHAKKKLKAGTGFVGKIVVAGAKERETNHVKTKVIPRTDTKTLQQFVAEVTEQGVTFYTDEHSGYVGMPRKHSAIRHSKGHFVNGRAHTNGIESFWGGLETWV